MKIEKVTIIGLGALGVLFGHHLSKQMPDNKLQVIADEARVKKYKKNGIYSNGEACEFHYVTPDEQAEPADLLVFFVKYDGLKDAIKAVKNHVGENTIILSALNGISSEAIIGETYHADNILYCVAQGMDAVKVGNKLTYEHMGMLCFGDKTAHTYSEKTKAVADFFERNHLPHQVDMDMKKRMWGKFMLNVGVNQTVAVYRSNYGLVQQSGEARETMIAAMREVMLLSEYENVFLTEDDIHYWLSILGTLSPEGKPSMAQDIDASRYSEVDLFSGTVLDLGKKHNVPTLINKRLYEKIKLMESKYRQIPTI